MLKSLYWKGVPELSARMAKGSSLVNEAVSLSLNSVCQVSSMG